MKVVCDTAPLVAAADRASRVHRLAATLIRKLGRDLVVLDTVLVEADYMLRARVGVESARRLTEGIVAGSHSAAFMSPGLLGRAAALDLEYGDLNLGLVDASIMAYAERHRLPILTFDFRDFRATSSNHGPWRLVVSEGQLATAAGRR